ncbi:MAG: segregation/condensation protein A [Candidatus Doudnabacteria bacterium]
MTQIKLQQFEGPLDLLLNLIEQQELSVTEISLAQVTEQFLQYVKALEQIDPTSLADYLTIAARLLVIKSKAILPTLEVQTVEEESELDLTERLLVYKQFKEAAKAIKQLDDNKKQSFTRSLVFSERINFFPDPSITPNSLHQAILGIVTQLKELDNLPKAKVKEAISISDKISHIQAILSNQVESKLSQLLSNTKTKDEAIVTFLALLELIKQRVFTVDQEDLFSDVTITQYQATTITEISSEEETIIEETTKE